MYIFIILVMSVIGAFGKLRHAVLSPMYKGKCVDIGCEERYGNNGVCVDFSVATVDFGHLTSSFNLSAGSIKGLCGHQTKSKGDCCHCMQAVIPRVDPFVAGLLGEFHEGNIGSVLVLGGDTASGATSTVETLLGQPLVPTLPRIRWGHTAFVLPDSQIVVCGGKSKHHNVALSKNCISLDPQTKLWSNHSILSQPRIYASEVTMPNGMVFLVGGWYSERTSEVLMPGSSEWTKGPHLPHPLDSACALPMDDNTFVAIGGGMYHTKVISYNMATSKWNDTWPQLAEGRRGHSCAKLGSNLMVAGGYSYTSFAYSDSTIMIDTTTGAATTLPKMSTPRAYFSLQAVNGAILAVGGVSNNGYTGGVEVFNPDEKYWTQNVPEDFGLQTPRSAFATVFIQNKTESELKLVEIELPLVGGGVNIELPIDPTTTSPPHMAKQGPAELTPVTASLSSTHSIFSAANCIDGKTENSGDANMCATKEENAPWLAIDYGTDVLVERVEIFNRINCCGDRARNIDVYISNALPTSANEMYDEGGPRFGHYDGPGEDGEHIIISGPPTPGRYVIVQINFPTNLNFEEVKAFGRAKAGPGCFAMSCYDTDKDPRGEDFVGCANKTASGRTCQAWGSTSPHKHGLTSLKEHGNNCRNPDNYSTPWCYTTDPGKRWEACDIACPKKE